MRVKVKKRYLLSAVGVLFLILFSFAGRFLVLDEPPQKSDVIIVLSGDCGRVEKGVALFKAGFAPYLLLSNSRLRSCEDASLEQQIANYRIAPTHIILETQADSTYQNAVYTKALMTSHSFQSAIVVSSDYHMRRVKFNFSSVYKNSGIRLTYTAAPSHYNPTMWWADSNSRYVTIQEYMKVVGNAMGLNGEVAKGVLHRTM